MPVFGPSTYANLKANLTWTTAAFLAVLEFVSLEWLATPDQRALVLDRFDQSALTPVIVGVGVVLAILTVDWFVAYWIANTLKLHELWDTYVSHWRVDYDVNFILPALIRPFAGRVPAEFATAMRAQRNRAMTLLFYRFVRDEEPVIGKVLIVRFYEAIQSFWVCQLLELALVFVAAEVLILVGVDQAKGTSWGFLAPWLVVVVFLLALNRLLIHRVVLPRVRAATQEEIDEIILDHRPQLERQLAALHEFFGLTFETPAAAAMHVVPGADQKKPNRSSSPRGSRRRGPNLHRG